MNLDSINEINKLDSLGMLASIIKLPEQIIETWDKIASSTPPESCKLAKNVVISGMGGSALGGRIVDSLMSERARVPIEVFTEFRLPNYVNSSTFVIVSSYSGNTQETLAIAKEALSRGASVFGITTGGDMEHYFKTNQLSYFKIDPTLSNPSNQPRMGLGYSITAVLATLAKCEFINLLPSEIEEAIGLAKGFVNEFGVGNPEHSNLAKLIARKFFGKIPVLIASEHLVGSTHAFKNQLNENSKNFAVLFDVPELNHHLLEGLAYPAMAKTLLKFLFLESDLYSYEIIRRYPITMEVVEKNNIETLVYKARARRKLPQIFELLVFGSFVSFYLSMLNGIDPSPIVWVDYFKQRL